MGDLIDPEDGFVETFVDIAGGLLLVGVFFDSGFFAAFDEDGVGLVVDRRSSVTDGSATPPVTASSVAG